MFPTLSSNYLTAFMHYRVQCTRPM